MFLEPWLEEEEEKLINEIKVWEMGLGLIRETRKQRQEEERKREIIEEWSCRDKAKRRA